MTDLFDIGASSLDILQMKLLLQKRLNIPNIPLTTFFGHPFIHELATALMKMRGNPTLTTTTTYNPVVNLQSHGHKTPLWLLHHDSGEILGLMNLARHFTDRPIYALRSLGFDGEVYSTSFSESIVVFHSAIKSTQPQGPYALLGGILAFELAKTLEGNGDEVKFLGIMDMRPKRPREEDWYEVVLELASSLGVLGGYEPGSMVDLAWKDNHAGVVDTLISHTLKSRVQELCLDKEKLGN
jgi:Thioesterase domain/Phosphopantetheine attachment site